MRTIFVAIAMVLSTASLAQAQYYGGGWGYHSSTLQEGAQRGFADVIRSAGAAELLNSEAAKNYQDARKKYLENRLQATQTYFDMRRLNTEARRSERSMPLSTEAYARLARQQAPERLSVSQLDPLTGTIVWPAPLRRPEYDAPRQELERLYTERANGTSLNYDDIQVACDRFQEQLQADLGKFEPNDFIRAKKFIDSLAYEPKVAQR